VSIAYLPTGGKVIARPVVGVDGSFSAIVARPSTPAYTSNSARYLAALGGSKSAWIKLTRRMGTSRVTYTGNGRLQVDGQVSLPIAKGQPLRVERSDACGQFRQIGSVRIRANGSFNGTVATGGGSSSAVIIRLKARVAKASNPRYRFNTYSIVQPVVVER
jgi:flagellar basal body rod protein FlgG